MEIPNSAVLLIKSLFFTADDSFADIFCFVFHEYNFGKMKISDGIKVFSFCIDKVWKKYGKWFLKLCRSPASRKLNEIQNRFWFLSFKTGILFLSGRPGARR